MKSSIANGALGNALSKAGVTVASWQVASSGGVARLTSFCSRHVYGVPAWSTCVE
jgi:hypothetical protein